MLVKDVHSSIGHLGFRRTAYSVAQQHWWSGIFATVRRVLRRCSACSRAQATFNHQRPVLQNLPIMGLMYRFGLDIAGPFKTTSRGHKYVLVCIEYFSKYVETFPLRSKSAEDVSFAFLHGILARYGACAEVVTDGGGSPREVRGTPCESTD